MSADARALELADKSLRESKPFLLRAVRVQPHALRFAGLELKKDADVVYAAVQVDGKALKHVRWAPVSASKRIVLEAVLQDARALEYADESLGLGVLGADAAIEVLRAGVADDARRSAEVGRALLRRSISRETS